MSKLSEYLNRNVVGNVFEAPAVRQAYARDRSILEITPRLVAIPEHAEDVQKILRFIDQLAARGLKLEITPRGSGLDTTGADLGDGLCLSLERLSHIEEIDARGRLVRVEPAVTLELLNSTLRPLGLCLPLQAPPRATIGGLIAGAHRDILNYVEKLELVLPSGEPMNIGPASAHAVRSSIREGSSEGAVYRSLKELLDQEADAILDRSMQSYDRAGYAGLTKIRDRSAWNLLPLISGSQGTLGVITDIILHVELLPRETRRFGVILQDIAAVERLLSLACELEVANLRLADVRTLRQALAGGKRSGFCTHLPEHGFLILISTSGSKFNNTSLLSRLGRSLPKNAIKFQEAEGNSADFATLENFFLESVNGTSQSAPICDGVSVPPANFAKFIQGLSKLEEAFHLDCPVFGDPGYLNIRPAFDFASLDGRRSAVEFLRLYGGLIKTLGGSVAGGSPEGRTKTLAGVTFDATEQRLYTAVKAAFDPHGIMNPGTKLGSSARSAVKNLRTSDICGMINV